MISLGVIVIMFAILIDIFCGEPPNRFHPVAWMGSLIGRARSLAPGSGNANQLAFGLAIVLIGGSVAMASGFLIEWIANRLPWLIGLVLQAAALKCCFGIRSLWSAAMAVRNELVAGDLPAARRQLAYHLVSRDVSDLNAADISAATIESVAENTSDSVVGPILFYLLGGLPAAIAYRYINTCDAMLGYRTAELRWLGKPAARTDDLVNLIPARITAALMVLASPLARLSASQACRIWWRDSNLTPSPNGGHPMSVAAGAIGIQLEKPGHYLLASELRQPAQCDIQSMLRLFQYTVLLTALSGAASAWIFQSILPIGRS